MFFTMVSCRDSIKNSNQENVTMNGGNPPSMPSGEMGNPLEKPNGDMENMTPPDKPGEVNNNVEVDNIYQFLLNYLYKFYFLRFYNTLIILLIL